MKKLFLFAMFSLASWMGVNAMSFERAQAEALYLTDKMAYELNLNEQQYNDAYEINLDYFLRMDSPSDLYGNYYSYRLSDLRCILYDWQFGLLMAADYFLRPVVWRAGGWYFPIYSYYNRGYFYYNRPLVWRTYYGGHSRLHYQSGFYANRRPHWDGGLRGHDMHRPSVGMNHSSHNMGGRAMDQHRSGSGSNHGGMNHGSDNRGGSGNHGNVNPGQHSGGHSGMSRGNSFDGSSSRSHSGSYGSPSMGGSSRSGSYGSPSMGGSSRGSSYGSSRGMGGSSRSGSFGGGSSRGSSHGGSLSGGSRGGGSRSGGRR